MLRRSKIISLPKGLKPIFISNKLNKLKMPLPDRMFTVKESEIEYDYEYAKKLYGKNFKKR
jgi:hypothetical protein